MGKLLLEDGSGGYQLESGSGNIILEGAIEVTITPATESDGSQTLDFDKVIYKSLTATAETDTGQALDADKHKSLIPAGWPRDLRPSDLAEGFGQGFGFLTSLALDAAPDGSVVVVGAPTDTEGGFEGGTAGAVYIYEGANLATETKLLNEENSNDRYGEVVAISADGSTLAVAAPGRIGDQGRVYVYTAAGGWAGTPVALQASDGDGGYLFGSALAISDDGSVIAVGQRQSGAGTDRGAVYVYSDTDWGVEAKLTASDAADGDLFGFGESLAISGDGSTVVVGAAYASDVYSYRGAVYVYDGASWGTETKLMASDPGNSDNLGVAVDVTDDGATIFAGAPGWDGDSGDEGAVYVFSDASWATEDRIDFEYGNQFLGYWISCLADGSAVAGGAFAPYGETYVWTVPGLELVRQWSANSDGIAVAPVGKLLDDLGVVAADQAGGRIFEFRVGDVAQALVYGFSPNKTLAPATETDAAQAIDADKHVAVTTTTEADAAQAIDVDKHVTITAGAETDAAQGLTVVKTIYKTITAAVETGAAQALSVTKTIYKAITAAVETDAAQALVYVKTIYKALTAATEADAAQSLDVDKHAAIAASVEADAAQALSVTHVHYRTVTAGTETDAAQALDADKHATLTPGTESDAAQALDVDKTIYKSLTTATETDAAQALVARKFATVVAAVETGVAQALVYVKTIYKALTAATETDTAQSVAYSQAGSYSIVEATESDSAQAVDADKHAAITPATEADAAQALDSDKYRALTPATENDAALALSYFVESHAVTLTPATESNSAQALTLYRLVAISPATENDAAFTLTFHMAAGPPGSPTFAPTGGGRLRVTSRTNVTGASTTSGRTRAPVD